MDSHNAKETIYSRLGRYIMFKLFSRKKIEGVNNDYEWLGEHVNIDPNINTTTELTLDESFEVILERLDAIEVKIDRLLEKN